MEEVEEDELANQPALRRPLPSCAPPPARCCCAGPLSSRRPPPLLPPLHGYAATSSWTIYTTQHSCSGRNTTPCRGGDGGAGLPGGRRRASVEEVGCRDGEALLGAALGRRSGERMGRRRCGGWRKSGRVIFSRSRFSPLFI